MKLEASYTRPIALHIRPRASHTRPKRRTPARSWQDIQDIQFCAAQPALRHGPALLVGLRPLGTKRKGGSVEHTPLRAPGTLRWANLYSFRIEISAWNVTFVPPRAEMQQRLVM